jgi:hypothetical protein
MAAWGLKPWSDTRVGAPEQTHQSWGTPGARKGLKVASEAAGIKHEAPEFPLLKLPEDIGQKRFTISYCTNPWVGREGPMFLFMTFHCCDTVPMATYNTKGHRSPPPSAAHELSGSQVKSSAEK